MVCGMYFSIWCAYVKVHVRVGGCGMCRVFVCMKAWVWYVWGICVYASVGVVCVMCLWYVRYVGHICGVCMWHVVNVCGV